MPLSEAELFELEERRKLDKDLGSRFGRVEADVAALQLQISLLTKLNPQKAKVGVIDLTWVDALELPRSEMDKQAAKLVTELLRLSKAQLITLSDALNSLDDYRNLSFERLRREGGMPDA